MSFSQKGANYRNQADLERKDRILGEALADIASQVQAIRTQANLGQAGAPSSPHPITAVSVVGAGGFANLTLIHANAPAGTQYVIQHATTGNFQNPVEIDNGSSKSWQAYKSGQTLYFRAAPRFAASALAPWTYFGSSANPTPTTF